MYKVTRIAQNTFREIIRDRILYGLLVFTVLLIGLSVALGQLSFAEQIRISANFGLSAIHLGSVILAVFLGSTLVSKEIDKKTVFTLLVRPVSRVEFLCGKSFGLLAVILFSIVLLGAVLSIVLVAMGMELKFNFFLALLGTFLEATLLLSLTLFFSVFSRPISTICFSLSLFLIGHWLGSLSYFVSRGERTFLVRMGQWVAEIFPNLELFNWRSLVVYGESLAVNQVLWALFYCFAWFSFFISLTSMIFWKRDFS